MPDIAAIEAVRAFSRFYTGTIGALETGHLATPFSLGEARTIYEVAGAGRRTAAEIARAMSSDPAQIDALREKIRRIEAGERVLRGVLPFGVPDLDERLPGGGLALGALHEIAGGANGALDGATAALFAAGILARTHGQVLWCVSRRDLFAPALAQGSVD